MDDVLSVTPFSEMTVLENVFIPIPELVSLGSKTLAPPLPPPQPVDRPRMWRERGREGGATTREDTRKLPVTMTGKRAEGVHHPAEQQQRNFDYYGSAGIIIE